MISVISETINKNTGRRTTGCVYPEELGLSAPEECLLRQDIEIHRWITEDGKPPKDGESCLCGDIQYYSG